LHRIDVGADRQAHQPLIKSVEAVSHRDPIQTRRQSTVDLARLALDIPTAPR